MARIFVRSIKDTILKGIGKEPLHTNDQNDLLSDNEHVYVRNKDEYHCLTDNIKEIKSGSDNVTITDNGDNTSTITVTGEKQKRVVKNSRSYFTGYGNGTITINFNPPFERTPHMLYSMLYSDTGKQNITIDLTSLTATQALFSFKNAGAQDNVTTLYWRAEEI